MLGNNWGSSRETIYQELGFESLNPIQDGLFWGCSRIGGGGGQKALKSAAPIIQ